MLSMYKENFPSPPVTPLSDAAPLSMALLEAARAVSVQLDARTTGPRMTAAQARRLRHLEHKSVGMSLGELAELGGISTTAVSQMMDRIGRHGYVRLETNPWDSRSTAVSLTAHGRREYERIMRGHAAFDRLLNVWMGPGTAPRVLTALSVIRARAAA